MRISHIGIDRKHTTAADINSYFPLKALKEAEGAAEVWEEADGGNGHANVWSHLNVS